MADREGRSQQLSMIGFLDRLCYDSGAARRPAAPSRSCLQGIAFDALKGPCSDVGPPDTIPGCGCAIGRGARDAIDALRVVHVRRVLAFGAGRMARILIVDDDADVRELIELALDGQGYDVDSVESGRAALERLAQHAYDLLVCDLHMPDRDGPAVYRAIERRAPPRPAFLFVTGYADAGPYEDFLRTAQVPVLGKPFDIHALRETVSRLLSGT